MASQRLTVLDWIIALIFLVVCGLFYRGFFSPDPTVVVPGQTNMFHLLLLVGVPAIALGLVGLYLGARSGKIPGTAVALLIGSTILCLLLLFPVATWLFYERSDPSRLARFHPYLQLAPNRFVPKTAPDEASTYRIFCLGGSTTEWKDPKGIDWPSRVETALAGAIPGRTVQVYNCGREWYTSQHSVINYAVNLRQHDPDAIVVMHALNDLLHNADFSKFSGGAFEPDYRHFYGPITRLIKGKSLFGAAAAKFRSHWNHTPREVVTADSYPGLVSFTRNLQTLVDMARLDSIPIILMTEPNLFKDGMSPEEQARLGMLNTEAIGPTKKWSLESARTGMRQYNDAIRSFAGQQGVFVIDLETAVPKTLEYFADDVHYREAAFPVIAAFVADEIRRQGVLPADSLK